MDKSTAQFRTLLSRFFKSGSFQQKIKTNLQVLDLYSVYDYKTAWKQTRKVRNATLFNRTTKYQAQKGRADSYTLIYTGKLGSRKSILLANIVNNLNLYIQSKNITVAYFFYRHDIPKSLKARTVISSLARQLLRPISDLLMVAELLKTTSALDFKRIFYLIKRALLPDYKAYFILNRLDKCNYTKGKILI